MAIDYNSLSDEQLQHLVDRVPQAMLEISERLANALTPRNLNIAALKYLTKGESRPPAEPPAPLTYEKKWFLQKTGLSPATILSAMKRCGVVPASRGDKSHRYTKAEAEKLLQHIAETAQAEKARGKAKQALEELSK